MTKIVRFPGKETEMKWNVLRVTFLPADLESDTSSVLCALSIWKLPPSSLQKRYKGFLNIKVVPRKIFTRKKSSAFDWLKKWHLISSLIKERSE